MLERSDARLHRPPTSNSDQHRSVQQIKQAGSVLLAIGWTKILFTCSLRGLLLRSLPTPPRQLLLRLLGLHRGRVHSSSSCEVPRLHPRRQQAAQAEGPRSCPAIPPATPASSGRAANSGRVRLATWLRNARRAPQIPSALFTQLRAALASEISTKGCLSAFDALQTSVIAFVLHYIESRHCNIHFHDMKKAAEGWPSDSQRNSLFVRCLSDLCVCICASLY